METITKFNYNESDYNISLPLDANSSINTSRFDNLIEKKWEDAVRGGYFRYNLDFLTTKVLDGNRNFVIQLNTKRLNERREGALITDCNTEYDPKEFNFTKINPREILFQLNKQSEDNKKGSREDMVAINVSPLEKYHVLLIPSINQCRNQKLTRDAIELGLEFILLSSKPGWRIGYNGLCALASVNHQHLHGWLFDQTLYTETISVEKIYEPLFKIKDNLLKGFVLQLFQTTIEQLTEDLFIIINYFQEHNTAYNLFMTRGEIFESNEISNISYLNNFKVCDVINENSNNKSSTVRIYIWPRKKVLGSKSNTVSSKSVPFNIACAELGGHIPYYDLDSFDKVKEEEIENAIADEMLSCYDFSLIENALLTKFKNVKNFKNESL